MRRLLGGLCVGYLHKMKSRPTNRKLKLVNRINGCKVMATQSFACFRINFLLPMNGAAAYLTLRRRLLSKILTSLGIALDLLPYLHCMLVIYLKISHQIDWHDVDEINWHRKTPQTVNDVHFHNCMLNISDLSPFYLDVCQVGSSI